MESGADLVVMGGADDEIRTRDIDLGKVALYQLSYIRIAADIGRESDGTNAGSSGIDRCE
jgi:hypothetical protein